MAKRGRSDKELKGIIEALLVASGHPVPASRIARILGAGVDTKRVRKLIEQMREEYDQQGRAFQIEPIAEGYQVLTRTEYEPWVSELKRGRKEDRLSEAATITLAIVAFKQPVLRVEVDDIRGFHTGSILRSLIEKNLVKVVGRQNVPGRPLLYGTTRRFLEVFGLKSLRNLPGSDSLRPRPKAVEPAAEEEKSPTD